MLMAYGAISTVHPETIIVALQDTVTVVKEWCSSKGLQFNANKTEMLWCGTATNLQKLSPADKSILIGSTVIEPVPVVRDLGVYFDSELTMREHVSHVTRTCFFSSYVLSGCYVNSSVMKLH